MPECTSEISEHRTDAASTGGATGSPIEGPPATTRAARAIAGQGTDAAPPTSRVLVVDDDRDMCELVAAGLRKRGHKVTRSAAVAGALAKLEQKRFDAVLSDIRLDGDSGLELCRQVVATQPDMPVVVMTAYGSLQSAVAAIRAGAYDFITKPLQMNTLAHTLDRAVQHRRLCEEVRRLRRSVDDPEEVQELIGSSGPMREVFDLVERVGDSDATVLITGASGTGKELVARALHERSGVSNGAFVAINCAAMPPALLESELFGHERGAFTDARRAREGLFVRASGGTLFLDEIGELPLEVQPKLLRALQESKVRPVGANRDVAFDARIIAATHRDLDELLHAGDFREDLYYRINVVQIDVPPLRDRGNDILLLAQHFIDRLRERTGRGVRGLSSAVAQKLLEYDWPGNVRELENCIERAVTLARFEQLTVDDLPESIRRYPKTPLVIGDDWEQMLPLAELERRYIQRVIEATGGNKTRAARILGLDRRTLYRKLKRYRDTGEWRPTRIDDDAPISDRALAAQMPPPVAARHS